MKPYTSTCRSIGSLLRFLNPHEHIHSNSTTTDQKTCMRHVHYLNITYIYIIYIIVLCILHIFRTYTLWTHYVFVCVYVCVSVCERAHLRDRGRNKQRATESGLESVDLGIEQLKDC